MIGGLLERILLDGELRSTYLISVLRSHMVLYETSNLVLNIDECEAYTRINTEMCCRDGVEVVIPVVDPDPHERK